MKRTLKILSFVFMFALLVTLGCLAVAAGDNITADDPAKADVTVAAYDSMTYTDAQGYMWTIQNPTGVDLVARYFADYDRYAFGVYSLKTSDVSKPYGTAWSSEWDGRDDFWEYSLTFAVDPANPNPYNINVAWGSNIFDDTGLSAGTYPNAEYSIGNQIDTITFNLVLSQPGGGMVTSVIAIMDAQNPETCESFILNADWGTVELIPADITVTDTASWTGIYDGQAHGGALTATPADVANLGGTPVTVYYSLNNVDFDTAYPTFTDAAVYTVYYKAEAANHNTATGTYTVTIAPRDIADATIVDAELSFVYNGLAQAPSVTEMQLVVSPAITLTLAPADFGLVYNEETSKGTYGLTINGQGNYTGSLVADWEITQAPNSWTVLPTIDGWTYTPSHVTSPAAIPSATPAFGTVVYEYKEAGAADDTYTEYDPAVFGKYPVGAGNYTLRAYVLETNDFAGIDFYPVDFTIAKADWDFTGIDLVQVNELIYNGAAQTALTNLDELVANNAIPQPTALNGITYDLTNVLDSCDVPFTVSFANYNDWTGTWSAQMSPKAVTILTDSAQKEYDGTPLSAPGYTIVADSLCGNDSLFVDPNALTFSSITYINEENVVVGVNSIYGQVLNKVIYDAANINSNYTIDESQYGTLTITQKDLSLTFAAEGNVSRFEYDGRVHTFTPTLQGTFRGAVAGELVGLSNTRIEIRGTDAGVYDIEPEDLGIYAAGGPNNSIDTALCYRFSVVASPMLIIDQKPITGITINDETVAYGDAVPGYTFVVEGLVYGESLNNVELTGDYAQDAACGIGDYLITFADKDAIRAANPNYSFADDVFVDATLTVIPMDIDNVVWNGDSFVYNGAAQGPVATAEGAYGQILKIETENGTNAGTYTATAISILTDASYDLANYNLIEIDTASFTIAPKPINSISINNVVVTYGSPVPTYTFVVSGLVEGETLNGVVDLIGDYAEDASCGVGDYGITFVDKDAIRAANPNYSMPDSIFADGTLTVIPMPIYNVAWDGYDYPYNGMEQGPVAIGVGAYGQILNIDSTKETYVGSYEAVAKEILPDPSYDVDNYTLVKFGMDTGFFTISEIVEVAFTSANVVIGDDYTINFKVPVLAFEQYGLVGEDVVVEMELGYNDYIVHYSDIQTVNYAGALVDFYVFSFENILPQNIGDTVIAWIDVGDSFDYREYSVADYCYNQLKKNGQDERFATALVALLRYAAAAQKFEDPTIADEDLVTYELENNPAYAVFNDYYTTTEYEDNDQGSGFNPAIIAGHSISVTLDNGANILYLLNTNGVEIPEINFVVNGVAYTGEIAFVSGRYQITLPVAFANVGLEYTIETYAGNTLIAIAHRSIEGYTAAMANDNVAKNLACTLVDFGTILDQYLKGEPINNRAPI